MNRYDARSAADPGKLAQQAQAAFSAQSQGPHAGHGESSMREVRYKGHRIRIETTYSITVDGKPVMGHVAVNNDGNVHYHSIPNQEFASAVDMVKRIIDLTPPDDATPEEDQPQDTGPSGHHH